MPKRKILSLTKKDFEIQTFRAGGKGGQAQNKTSSGVRIIHSASGARGEARDSRHQLQNKKNAFIRLTKSDRFQTWLKIQTGQSLLAEEEAKRLVDDILSSEDVLIERRVNGRWEAWE